MKRIVLITKQYPYSNREQFLDAELAYCGENNIPIDIVCAFVGDGEGGHRELPCGVRTVKKMNAGKMSLKTPLAFIKTIFSSVRAAEIKMLKQEKRYNHLKGKRLFKFLLKAITIATEIERLYKKELASYPDNIILYSYWTEEAALAAAILKQRYGCKAISRIHGYDLYLERHSECYLPFHRHIISSLSLVCPVSDTGRDYLLEKYGSRDNIRTQRLATVDYGITAESDGKFTVASCSNVIELKRVGLIAETMVKLDDEGVRWIHFGDGSLLNEVKKIASGQTKTECIIAGRVDHSSIFEYYKTHHIDLFINVSTTEGLPVSIMEAASFGIPTVATDVGGTKEIVFDGVNGKLLPSDLSSDDLANAIKEQINMTQQRREEQSLNSRRIWFESYEYRNTYGKFYDYILSKGF